MKETDALEKLFIKMEENLKDIKVINLTTLDGFPIYTHYAEETDIGDDRLSAAASSLSALSVAASKQLIGSDFESTTIESKDGCMLLVQTEYKNDNCVLCFVTGKTHMLGQVRYFAIKLAKYIQKNFN